jgi:DHA1 family tetracycline resistance protein-like MFS transporter
LRRPVLSRLILIFFLVILAFAGMESTFALWAMRQFRWGPEEVGYVFAYVGVLSAILQGGLIGRLTQRFGEERLLRGGLVLIGGGLVVLALTRGIPVLAIAVSALALGMGLVQPSLNSLISRRAGAEEQGEVLGVAQSVGSLSRVLGPAAAGILFAEFGRASPFFWGAALVVAAFAAALGLAPSQRPTSLAEPSGSSE